MLFNSVKTHLVGVTHVPNGLRHYVDIAAELGLGVRRQDQTLLQVIGLHRDDTFFV